MKTIYKETTCPVCGNKIVPHAENTYVVEVPHPPICLTFTPEWFDAIDCPMCGCQIKLAPRLPRAKENILDVSETEVGTNGEK